MQKKTDPENYIIIENKDGTFSAFVNYGTFENKETAEESLRIIMDMMGYKLEPNYTIH